MAGRKLKVFQTQMGFYDTVVAAPGQAAALRAWGARQDLFAGGEAKLVTDASAVAAALKHPNTPLRRAVGSNDPFRLEPSGLPRLPDAPKRRAVTPVAQPRPAAAQPPADRSALDAAEAALRRLNDERKREEADLRRRQTELGAAKAKAQADYVEARKAAEAAVAEARQAYRKTGGAH